MKRAIRRHHYYRLKKKRKYHCGVKQSDEDSAFYVNTPTPCSCPLCGNPRKYYGEKTRQEVIVPFSEWNNELDEIYDEVR